MNRPKTRNENIVVQEIEKEILIYDLKTNKALCLNETSAIIYGLCNGNRSVTEIADLMSVKLKTLVSEEFVWLTLNELKREDLLEIDSDNERFLNSVSRRELVKKAGIASMIALPLVTSLIAPKASQAASNTCRSGFAVCPGIPGGCCPDLFGSCCGTHCCGERQPCCGSGCCQSTEKCCGQVCCFTGAQCCGLNCCNAGTSCRNGICVSDIPF